MTFFGYSPSYAWNIYYVSSVLLPHQWPFSSSLSKYFLISLLRRNGLGLRSKTGFCQCFRCLLILLYFFSPVFLFLFLSFLFAHFVAIWSGSNGHIPFGSCHDKCPFPTLYSGQGGSSVKVDWPVHILVSRESWVEVGSCDYRRVGRNLKSSLLY